MVWVGSGHEGKSEKSQEKGVQSSGLWHPEDSIPSDNTFAVNYEKITKNVETLNTLAGEGSLKVSKNSQRATLKVGPHFYSTCMPRDIPHAESMLTVYVL